MSRRRGRRHPLPRGQSIQMIPISAAHRERFERCAPAALMRRKAVGTQIGQSMELVLMGSVPIVGMLRFDWSAGELLIFLLVGTWVKILCDFLRVLMIRGQVEKLAEASYDDWHVWTMVDALRTGQTKVPKSHIEAKFAPWPGILIDFVFGGTATLIICIAVAQADSAFGSPALESSGVMWSLLTLNAYQVLLTLVEILRHRIGNESSGVVASPGVREIGLFLLMFFVVFVSQSEVASSRVAQAIMLSVNGFFIAFGLFGVGALVAFRGETIWLENYLRETRPSS